MQPGPFELAELKGGQLLPRATVRRRAAQLGQRVGRRTNRREGPRRGRGEHVEPAESVEDVQVRGGIEEDLMFVLSVELDQATREILQRARRDQLAVDEGATPALRGDFPAHDHLFPAAVENGFDGRRVLARSHEVGRRRGRQAAG